VRALLRCLVAILISCGSACAGTPPTPEAVPKGPPSSQPTVSGEYLVTLSPGVEVGTVEQVYGRFGLKRIQDLGNGVVLVALGQDPGLERMTELQARDSRIKAVQPNFVYRAFR
jgi:hypothetical protein